VTGGAHRFKTHRCKLRHFAFGLNGESLSQILHQADLSKVGFVEIKSAIRDGYIEFAGRFAIGEHQADLHFEHP